MKNLFTILLLGFLWSTSSSLLALPTHSTQQNESMTVTDHHIKQKKGRWFKQLKEKIGFAIAVSKNINDAEKSKKLRSMSIASLVLGIASFIFLGPLASIPALILGIIVLNRTKDRGLSKENADGSTSRGLALAGVILAAVNLAIFIFVIGFVIFTLII